MIIVDLNNICIMKYSIVQRELFQEEKEFFKRTNSLEINERAYERLRRGFINLVIKDLAFHRDRFQKKYGELVIASDYKKSHYWRKTIHPEYKANRDAPKSNLFEELIWKNFHKDKEELVEILKNLNMKVLHQVQSETDEFGLETIEADDIGGVLTRSPGLHIIVSSDGDFDQLLIDDRIKRFNLLEGKLVSKTKKEINEKNKYYLIMGQPKDNIPHVKDKSELTDDFIKFMKEKYQIELKKNMAELITSDKYSSYVKEYETFKYNEDTVLLNEGKRKKRRNLSAFEKPNFGEVAYEKTFSSMSVDAFLELNPIYRKNYELNKQLYLLENIPKRIVIAIGKAYLSAEKKFDNYFIQTKFLEYGLDILLGSKFK